MPNFSIISPTYENPDEFEIFLASLKNSDIKSDFELIVVDDGPTNKIEQIVQKNKDLPLKFIKLKEHAYIGQKRTIGAKKAKNEILFFIDSDIILEKDSLRIILETMQHHPEVAMMGGTIMQDGKQLHPTKNDRLIKDKDISYCEVMYSAFLALYKSAFLSLDGYDDVFENRGEGTDLSIRFWRAGFPIARNLKSIVIHPSFKKARKTPDKIAEMYRSLFLVAYKYDIEEEKNPHFIEMYQERKDVYGETCEFYAIYAVSKYIDWFNKNYNLILKSKENIPKEFDFKPFDVFTDKKMLETCIEQATKKIAPFYKKAF